MVDTAGIREVSDKKEQEGQMLSVIHLEVVDIFTYQIKQSSFNSTSSTIM